MEAVFRFLAREKVQHLNKDVCLNFARFKQNGDMQEPPNEFVCRKTKVTKVISASRIWLSRWDILQKNSVMQRRENHVFQVTPDGLAKKQFKEIFSCKELVF